MLQTLSLDTDRFEDIVEEAKKKISVLYPKWTDYNYHDPGITMIELFAWLKEVQQYYLDQIGTQNQDIFYRLLGVSRKHREAAQVRLKVDIQEGSPRRLAGEHLLSGGEHLLSAGENLLPAGSRFYAGDLAFETISEKRILQEDVSRLMILGKEGYKAVPMPKVFAKEQWKEYPLGRDVKDRDFFYLIFNAPLPVGKTLDIFFRVSEDSPIKRNPIQSNPAGNFTFYPLAKLSMEYYTKSGFKKLPIKEDETQGLLKEGAIYFELTKEMEETSVEGEKGYFLKIQVNNPEYDVPPLLSGISINTVCARQEETVINLSETDELPLLGVGNGFSNQCFSLEDENISYYDLEFGVREGGKYKRWEKVENFYRSGPQDCHYVFREESGEILFGNGIYGKCPLGEIGILCLKRTRGSKGNVKSGTVTGGAPGIKVENQEPARGGRDSESMEETMAGFLRTLKENTRLVTGEDYEKAIRKTPGLLIHGCKVIEEKKIPGQIQVVVKPYSEGGKGGLSEAYRRNIESFLEDKRMIGTRVRLLSPEYIEVELFADIFLKSQYTNARKDVENGIYRYFEERLSAFGKAVTHSRIMTLLSRMEAVEGVKSLTITSKNEKAVTNFQGDLLLPPSGIALPGEIRFLFRTV